MAEYGVPPERVHVVIQGASIDRGVYKEWESLASEARARRAAELEAGAPLRIVFVGKYWHRKGLDRLLRALAIARSVGAELTLRVIGCTQEELPLELRSTPGVEWCGFVDKRRDPLRFLRLVSECDIGCLLSRAEAGGIAIREYVALGLIILGTAAGGAPEQMLRDAALIVPVDAGDDEIAQTLIALNGDFERVKQLRCLAWQGRHSGLWTQSVKQLKRLWAFEEPSAFAQ
jgi:glycosyltransferase involved in cell wall biosynthesis